jgi:hypothetical protein
MAYIGNKLADAYTSFAKQDFTTSATTSYTLDYPVANANEIALFINFVRQEPTTAYSASGTSLTLTSATSASDDMYCVFLGKALQTVNPPAGSVGASQISDGSITLAKLSATGTASSSTFLRGDNSWQTAGGNNTPSFMATHTGSGQNLTNNATNTVAANNEVFDSDNAYDHTTYRFTVPSGQAGKYLFGLGFQVETGAAGNMNNYALRIAVNGSTVVNAADYPGGSTENRIPYDYTSAILDLSVGDYVEPQVFISISSGTPVVQPGTLQFYGMKLIGV